MPFVAADCFIAEINAPFLSADNIIPLDAGDAVALCALLGTADHTYVLISDGTLCATLKVMCSNGSPVAVDRTDGLSFPSGSCIRFVWTPDAICELTGTCDTTDSCASPIIIPEFDNTVACNPLDCVRLIDHPAMYPDVDDCSNCIAVTQWVCDKIDDSLNNFCDTNPCNFIKIPSDGSCIQGVTPLDDCGCDTCLATTEWVCNYVAKIVQDSIAALPDACGLIQGTYGSSSLVPVISVGPDGCIVSITTVGVDSGDPIVSGIQTIDVCSALELTGDAQNPVICLTEIHPSSGEANGITYDVYGRITGINPLVGNVTALNSGNCILITPQGGGEFTIGVNAASTLLPGCVRLATDAEAVLGTAIDIAVTPQGLAAAATNICAALSCSNYGELNGVIFSNTVVADAISVAVNINAQETLVFYAHLYGDTVGDISYEISVDGNLILTRTVTVAQGRNPLGFTQPILVPGPVNGTVDIELTAGSLTDPYGVINGQIFIRCECA